MASSQFSVIKSEGTFVLPSEPMPNHTLPLSWFDKFCPTVANGYFVYRHGPEQPAEVIKQALAKALVPYYPLAGRIVKSEQGEITGVACTGDGVWFVTASADCSLAAVMEQLVENPTHYGFPKDQLFPSHPNQVGMPMMLQVTQFTCGGFVVSHLTDHTFADGFGIAQIMKAVAEMARGLNQPTVKPVWLREHVPNPSWMRPKLRSHPPLENIIFDIPQDHIDRVKDLFMEQTSEKCSTFDVTVAQLLQCRTRAINSDPTVNACLSIAASSRTQLSHFFPEGTKEGYYGNCVFPLKLAAPSGKIVGASIVELVTLIRNTKKGLSDEFSNWAKGGTNPYTKMVLEGYDLVIVSDLSCLGFSELDYGWGQPAFFGRMPVSSELNLPPCCIMTKPPVPMVGRRLTTRCVKKEHLEAFHDQMINFSTNMRSAGTSRSSLM